jgi:enoyl-CoA hydratase/carnithine racemase
MTTQTTDSVFSGLKVVEIASFIAAPAHRRQRTARTGEGQASPARDEGLNDADAFARQSKDAHSLLDTEDAHEGALAFAEKRAPVWRGR